MTYLYEAVAYMVNKEAAAGFFFIVPPDHVIGENESDARDRFIFKHSEAIKEYQYPIEEVTILVRPFA